MIRRHKTTIFTDAKESTTVYELKRIVEGILKRTPEDQRLYKVSLEQSLKPNYIKTGNVLNVVWGIVLVWESLKYILWRWFDLTLRA